MGTINTSNNEIPIIVTVKSISFFFINYKMIVSPDDGKAK